MSSSLLACVAGVLAAEPWLGVSTRRLGESVRSRHVTVFTLPSRQNIYHVHILNTPYCSVLYMSAPGANQINTFWLRSYSYLRNQEDVPGLSCVTGACQGWHGMVGIDRRITGLLLDGVEPDHESYWHEYSYSWRREDELSGNPRR